MLSINRTYSGSVVILKDFEAIEPEDLTDSEKLEVIRLLMQELESAGERTRELEELSNRIVVSRMHQTCNACPSQWEGETDDGRSVYVRFRHGRLRIEVSGETVFSSGDCDGDGFMSYDELKGYTSHKFVWPATCTSVYDSQD